MQGVPLTPNANKETQTSTWELSASSEENVLRDPRAGRAPATEETSAVTARQEFEFPGNVESLAASREQIMEFVCQHCPDEAEQIDVLVALQEALANATGRDSILCWPILITSPSVLRAMGEAFA
jgi:hypothetical protein